jgi:D-alanyl-D-alanine dipeptidase
MKELYEQLSETYDLMIDWPKRLRREAFLYRTVFRFNRCLRVLDAACGTGMHARLFAKMGLAVAASNPVPEMIAVTRRNLGDLCADQRSAAPGRARLAVACFDELPEKCPGPHDVVTCVGNSLPHVLTGGDLRRSLAAMYAVLRDGGLVILHGNNYDEIVGNDDRLMPLRAVRRQRREYLFLRLLEGQPPILTFHVLTLVKERGKWTMSANRTQHRALFRGVLEKALADVGFCHPEFYGAWDFSPFEPLKSDHCIAIARKRIAGKVPIFKEPMSAVNRVIIRDNGEPLVDLEQRLPGLVYKERPCLVRATVAEMLAKAQSSLPAGLRLRMSQAYRSLERQQKLYRDVYEKRKAEHPAWSEAQLRRAVNKYVAPPDAKAPPGHSTGGAVDLSIADAEGRDLDMTSPFEFGIKGAATYSPDISPQTRANRQILINAMSATGFSNCADEWWHWSYGDSAWAARTGRHACCYGAAKTPQRL